MTAAPSTARPHRIAVVVPQNFTPFELGVALEAFAQPPPEQTPGWYDVRVCAARPGVARATRGLFAAAIPHGVEVIDAADTVIVPEEDELRRPTDPLVVDALRRAYARGARMVSFCTGAFVLAEAGVLDGRRAATHWQHARRLAREFPRVRVEAEALYVDDGQVLTSAGTAAGIDLSLHLIRKDFGARVAREVARGMVVAPHREGGQAQLVTSPVPHRPSEGGVGRAMAYAVEHLDARLSLDALAELAFMSTRNFSRRFREVTGTTPSRWVLHQRLARVRELLEETDLPIETIAQRTGFGSAVTLRQRFATVVRTSPSAYRRAFRARFDGQVAS
ncbi:GlxA family transcriptional regulator [Mumia sp. DW29H23]|uniref:GlxA family transcriptional regulator n=1 Tax=Mumia sp. DW29H23 TaxID=3421241 RepID=UPI003D69F431